MCSSPFYLNQKRKKAEDYALSLCHRTVCCLSYMCTHKTDVTNRAWGEKQKPEAGTGHTQKGSVYRYDSRPVRLCIQQGSRIL